MITADTLRGSLQERVDVLRQVPEFQGLAESELTELAHHAMVEEYGPETVLWKRGQMADRLLVVVTGGVMPRVASVEIVRPVRLVGHLPMWAALANGASGRPHRSGTVSTMHGDEPTVVLKIRYEAFKPFLVATAYRFAGSFAKDLMATDEGAQLPYDHAERAEEVARS